jgi:uncharacterized membrane protein
MASSTPTPAPEASSGLTNNLAAALVYIPFFIGLIIGIVFLVIEPYNKNRFVRFHSFQSIFLHIGLIALWVVWKIVMGVLTAISLGFALAIALPLSLLVWLAVIALMVFLAIQAYGNKEFKLPVIGDLAAKQAGA